MKKKKKVTAIQIVGGLQKKRPNPAKILKELNLGTNPEWTIHFGPIMKFPKKEQK